MDRKTIQWHEQTEWLHGALTGSGAFLVVNTPAVRANPMTIGWGMVGIAWGMPLFVALVRRSRYTYECIQNVASFVVSVPRIGELQEALALCGTRSGRDIDKIAAAGLTVAPAQEVDTPILADCGLHYECEIVARTQQLHSDFASQQILETVYQQADNHHQAVFGKILSAYTTKDA